MSLNLKIGSLLIRTLAKPFARRIKDAAVQHERFRKYCITFAQGLHRIDMRLRLGLLQDTAAIDKQIARDREEEKRRATVATVKTEAQTKADEAAAKDKAQDGSKSKPAYKPRIRPLSESKAIEMGANFISEAFLFSVAFGLVVGEYIRGRRKASNEREVHMAEFKELSGKVEQKDQKINILETKLSERDQKIDALEERVAAMEGSLVKQERLGSSQRPREQIHKPA